MAGGATPIRDLLAVIVTLRRAGFSESEVRRHGLTWMHRALEEVERRECADEARAIVAGFYAAAGQHSCEAHSGGDSSGVCCGNEVMRQVISKLLGETVEMIPYDEDPNAKPDEAAIRAFFCPEDPDQAPRTFGFEVVKGPG